jgi:hypothetical protein
MKYSLLITLIAASLLAPLSSQAKGEPHSCAYISLTNTGKTKTTITISTTSARLSVPKGQAVTIKEGNHPFQLVIGKKYKGSSRSDVFISQNGTKKYYRMKWNGGKKGWYEFSPNKTKPSNLEIDFTNRRCKV